MKEIKFPFLRAALLGACLSIAAACGGSADESPAAEKRAKLPSILDTKPAGEMTSIVPATKAPDLAEPAPLAEVPVPEPQRSFAELLRDGKRLSKKGQRAQAIELLEQAVEAKPRHAAAHVELARAYLADGSSRKAREHAALGVELAPQSSYAWNTLGRVELMDGDRDAAITSFERATDENSDNAYAWNNLGLTLLLEERYDEASRALEAATSGDAPTAYMWNNLALAYEHLDEVERARAAYRRAKELGSDAARQSLARLERGASRDTIDDGE
ncbi:MAG TPA: tetratricopeptide repeat protein [Kofleriaceae bacterium]|nr:tetratricopeptide repeat protein [Kofleriaceae bacterium]